MTAEIHNPDRNVGEIYLCVYGIGNRTCEQKVFSWKFYLLEKPSQKTEKIFIHMHELDTLACM
jgi:hypothetical protein